MSADENTTLNMPMLPASVMPSRPFIPARRPAAQRSRWTPEAFDLPGIGRLVTGGVR